MLLLNFDGNVGTLTPPGPTGIEPGRLLLSSYILPANFPSSIASCLNVNSDDKSPLASSISSFQLTSCVYFIGGDNKSVFETDCTPNKISCIKEDKSFLAKISSFFLVGVTYDVYGDLLSNIWNIASFFLAMFSPPSFSEPNNNFLTEPLAAEIALLVIFLPIWDGVPFMFCAKNLPTNEPAPSFLISASVTGVFGSKPFLNLSFNATLVGIKS